MDLDQFVSDEAPQEGGDSFQFENAKRLDVSLDGNVVAKAGSMVAYTGDVSFERKTRAASRGC
jgi:phosphoribosyl 1,2-cyclic phosphodiesterase